MYEKLFTGKNLVPDCKTLLASVNTKKKSSFCTYDHFSARKSATN